MIAGLGMENLGKTPVDENFALLPDALEAQISADLATGFTPAFVCANVGSTSSNAMDPLRAMGEICRRDNLWLHVDGAMSGTAALCPEFRFIHNGLELADSYTMNPHKWMFTNFDCNALYVRERQSPIDALSILPEYLRNAATDAGAVIDYRDWQISLGRRFRALKLWFVIRHYGVAGLQYHVRRHVELAQQLKRWIEERDEFELVAPAPLNLICFRHVDDGTVSEAILQRLNASGKLYLTHTRLADQYVIRLVVGQTRTEVEHVAAAWQALQAAAGEVMAWETMAVSIHVL